MFFYFKRIAIYNIQNIPKNKPVLLLSNHQNALLDALLIAVKGERFSYFLTRASVFKHAFVASFLKSLQMLPVYRIRDGREHLSNNNLIFEKCATLLHNNEAVVLFPEGNHNLKRTVRPLSKGFTRIVLNTLEKYPDTDLQLLPVGLNFDKAKNFPDQVSMYFGASINAKAFISGNKNEDVLKLKTKVQTELCKLTTHIPVDQYDETLNKLEHLNANFLNPKAVNRCIENNFESCKFNQSKSVNALQKVTEILLIFSFIVPYIIWKFLVKPKIKELEFISTFRFAIAITLAPIYLLITTIIVINYLGLLSGLLFLVLTLAITLCAVKL
ncbi:1-acyl-sn-glycerol-3-phosphate acyltransferase [Tamlana sp. 2201CG12-4]|uniref:1-acyl-sn-glycerol-3-phosphate acyltransferase n=1 Tax=Tamlana sp. 2201CG12-4 TaxID=3112582 RepID=UPI002DBBE5D8|nr:1-acyl-sn-glycerol-3-phosphate acyltransferase [Tamlana sp. 2201CG12-4]